MYLLQLLAQRLGHRRLGLRRRRQLCDALPRRRFRCGGGIGHRLRAVVGGGGGDVGLAQLQPQLLLGRGAPPLRRAQLRACCGEGGLHGGVLLLVREVLALVVQVAGVVVPQPQHHPQDGRVVLPGCTGKRQALGAQEQQEYRST